MIQPIQKVGLLSFEMHMDITPRTISTTVEIQTADRGQNAKENWKRKCALSSSRCCGCPRFWQSTMDDARASGVVKGSGSAGDCVNKGLCDGCATKGASSHIADYAAHLTTVPRAGCRKCILTIRCTRALATVPLLTHICLLPCLADQGLLTHSRLRVLVVGKFSKNCIVQFLCDL